MPESHLRFIHASDLHLDAPLEGIADIPSHLQDLLVDAPLRAAEKVFDTVIEEDAELLVLAGDVVSAVRSGPREILFLVEQFERLAERNVPVYWLNSKNDPDDEWSSASLLPDNVVRLAGGEASPRVHPRRDNTIVRIVALDEAAANSLESANHDDDVFTIGIARNVPDQQVLERQPIAYWALGGRHQRHTVTSQPMTIHYCGSPQGRDPTSTGPHGCTIVEISPAHAVTLTPVTTDVVRWHRERLEIDAAVDTIQLELQARQRLQRLLANHADQVLLINLKVTGQGPLLGALRHGRMAQDLASKLRTEFGHHSPALWTVRLTAEPRQDFPPEWYEEETMLGEFLRNVRQLASSPDTKIDLSKYLDPLPAELAAALDIPDAETRADVLQRAATLGADLLSGHAIN
jgi:DNA repair exonuclease SbcCD nuclease subunit